MLVNFLLIMIRRKGIGAHAVNARITPSLDAQAALHTTGHIPYSTGMMLNA